MVVSAGSFNNKLVRDENWGIPGTSCAVMIPFVFFRSGYFEVVFSRKSFAPKKMRQLPSVSYLLVRNDARFQNSDFRFVISSPNLTHPKMIRKKGREAISKYYLRFLAF